ncbi:uncharacterized protein LACBIDRAFT_334943 [Laccaria bicolor S238N-H82]|uniref:Predicted protein n=1 Tax=Laccaria bicolor (strain S238N-H82 / ATCC MYA-4686) TaxID=486041 RepID=B0E0V1_LACBS|nr:uncharacterized protein LACBIDRAFT_334943 [Laccaria bicolor S238N-H82]EDQ99509.1 predicted protein [Laccaria bicolor S238N-H82]|eukprot:XP_001889858.1 predicted protein [Laccaria bicolor S238N-H82]
MSHAIGKQWLSVALTYGQPLFLCDQILNLKDTLPHVADGSLTVTYKCKVELCSLAKLHLSGSDYDCSDVLRHLSVSSTATLKLYCQSTAVSDADFSSILTFVSGFWEPTAIILSAAKPPICSLKIMGNDSMGFSLQAWSTMLSFERLSDLLPIVFESPVRSGFLMPRGVNRNHNRSAFSPEVKRPDRTAKRLQTAVFCGL